jgi:uncharacterized protein YjbI with pentapeptide repeats
MAESSILWDTNSTGDGTNTGYTEAQMALWMQLFTQGADKSGVAPDRDNELAVSGTATPVSVATGSAIVHGTPYFNTSTVTVAIPTPSVASRYDRIVLRKSWSAQTVRIVRIAGSEGGGIPSVSQIDGTTWDMPLAHVLITTGGVITVTDERAWLSIVGDGDVVTAKLADDAVATAKILDANVTAAKIAANAVTTAKIADANVTTAKLPDSAVTTAKIADANVTTAKLPDSAVTTAKIADANVTTAKLPDSAVTTAKIADANVTTAKIADANVTAAKIADANVTAAKIASDAVTTAKILDANVTQAKLGTDTLRTMIIPLVMEEKTVTDTSYPTTAQYGTVYLNATKLPTGATVRFVVVFSRGTGTTISAQIKKSAGVAASPQGRAIIVEAVTGSELTTTGSSMAAYYSGDIAANLSADARYYGVNAKIDSGSGTLEQAYLLVEW